MASGKRSSGADERLREYRRKRDFTRSPEPPGGASPPRPGRRFCVQKHAARRLHYDLRLELDGVMKSWAVPKGPSLDPREKPLAVHTEDHPLEYASFEGAIPEGDYGGGTVMLWDSGEWEPLGDPHEGYEGGDLKFRLHGEKLRGDWVLARMGGAAGADARNWLLIKKKDGAARPAESYDVLAELPFSVASGRTMEEIAQAPEAVWTGGRPEMLGAAARGVRAGSSVPDPSVLPGARPAPTLPARPRPQLAGSAAAPPKGERWVHEIKLDGYRLLARIEDGEVHLLTRNGHDWTERFPEIARAVGRLPVTGAVLDGEVVALDEAGRPSFDALQASLGAAARRVYFVFDVLHAGGFDLRPVPLLERKAFLAALLQAAPMAAPTVQPCEHFAGDGTVVFEQAARFGLEGIVSKRADAPYVERRSETWLKVKVRRRQEFVVGGFTEPSAAGEGFGALLVGWHDPSGRLVYCGRVGSGFRDRARAALHRELRGLACEEPPFHDAERDPDAARARWVRPEIVVEVEFATWTRDRLLRHAAFVGRRDDLEPRDVVRRLEESAAPRGNADSPPAGPAVVAAPASPADASVAGVRISHPRRTVYPEARVTKVAVARYYETVAEWILPYVARRPLSLVRCPRGLAGESFYQRHVGEGFPRSIRGVPHGTEIEGEPYLLINDIEGLVALVQMGVLEIHTWGCRADDLERPDHLVFDLDPGEGIEWDHVVAAAGFVRGYLDDLGLRSFVKTTGGKGVHLVVPVVRRHDWEEVGTFARAAARDIARRAPRNFVATMSKELRRHRIYVDYLRNQRGSTAVAPYSTRARPGALVSTPLDWEELSADRPPDVYTVSSIPDRLQHLANDPWDGFRGTRQSITKRAREGVGME